MSHKILVVDDDEHFSGSLRDYLEKEGFEVGIAENGQRALYQLSEDQYDLVVLDIMMPKMDGWAACEAIKADPELRNIPIIISSVRVSDADKELARRSGAAEYFVKPYRYPELLEAIKKYL